jgi:E3 ubiquitin-protein ligase RNF14
MEDQREVELGCIAAIFPELVLGPQDSFTASLELPVHPGNPVKVVFPASAQAFVPDMPTPPQSDKSSSDGQVTPNPANNVESHDLSYLPPLQLHIVLPEGYPATSPPRFELSTEPEWLSRAYLDELQAKGEQMWEEVGHTEVVYEYLDSLQQAAEIAFGYAEGKVLEIPQEFKIALLDYDIKATQATFDKETFDCGVCLGKATSAQ